MQSELLQSKQLPFFTHGVSSPNLCELIGAASFLALCTASSSDFTTLFIPTMGGSMSVRESGLLDAINAGNYEFYDRDQAATPEERQEIALKAFTCDWYLGSVNAMSEN